MMKKLPMIVFDAGSAAAIQLMRRFSQAGG
jgi:hypothetical protein